MNDINKEFEQNTLRDLNLFAMGIIAEGYTPDLHEEFTQRMIENFDKALTLQQQSLVKELRDKVEGMKNSDDEIVGGGTVEDRRKFYEGYTTALKEVINLLPKEDRPLTSPKEK